MILVGQPILAVLAEFNLENPTDSQIIMRQQFGVRRTCRRFLGCSAAVTCPISSTRCGW